MPRMPINLHVRDVPDEVHRSLVARAEGRGTSLRQYVLEVLTDHTALPTLDEWLDDVARMPASSLRTSGAEAVRASREEDDDEVRSARVS